jgi:flagellar biosynthesis/type III secretory pathway chaperone
MNTAIAEPREIAPRPVSNPMEAQELISHLTDVMEALLEVVQEETLLVRGGQISKVERIERPKAELARLYLRDTTRLKASHAYLARTVPDALAALRSRHENFQSLMQINLTVLATAHAVSEGIMRGVSQELARKASPQVYGASGRAAQPSSKMAPPLALSRVL